MLRRNDAAFRLAVNRALAEIYRSGDIAPIYERWFGAFGKPSPAIRSDVYAQWVAGVKMGREECRGS